MKFELVHDFTLEFEEFDQYGFIQSILYIWRVLSIPIRKKIVHYSSLGLILKI